MKHYLIKAIIIVAQSIARKHNPRYEPDDKQNPKHDDLAFQHPAMDRLAHVHLLSADSGGIINYTVF